MSQTFSPHAPLKFGTAHVLVLNSPAEVGAAAAEKAAHLITAAIQERGRARIMVGTGNSQDGLINSLISNNKIDWSRVEAFHMDEYVGIPADHTASFRRWLRVRFAAGLPLAGAHYLAGDAPDIWAEIDRYSQLLAAGPLDVAFVGFGENGHIAFNDPAYADFSDPLSVKAVTLDETCRRQQVGEGHFKDLASVPAQALTVTCSKLLSAQAWVCAVPERRKAEAVKNALLGPVSTSCPASVARRHARAFIFLDPESASLLSSVKSGGVPALDAR